MTRHEFFLTGTFAMIALYWAVVLLVTRWYRRSYADDDDQKTVARLATLLEVAGLGGCFLLAYFALR